MVTGKMGWLAVAMLLGGMVPVGVADEDLSRYWPNTGAVSAGSRPGVNLMPNGSFEAGAEGWNLSPGAEIVEGDAADGTKALHMHWRGEKWGPGVSMVGDLPLRPNTTYRGSVRVKGRVQDTSSSVTGYVQFVFHQMDAERDSLGYNWNTAPSRPLWQHEDWRTISLEFTPRSPRVRLGRVTMAVYNCTADLLIDDIKWEELEPVPIGRTTPVEGVVFPGRPSLMGMKVTGAAQEEAGPVITTVGARFRINAGESTVACESLLDAERPVCTLELGAPLTGLNITRNDEDMVVLENEHVAMSMNGDSLMLLCFARDTSATLTNLLTPRHYVESDGNILLIDERGGFAFYPSKDDGAGHLGFAPVRIPESFGEPGQTAEYRFGRLARVGLSLFPPRPFDWEKSWRQQVVYAGGVNPGINRYPRRNVLAYWKELGVTDAVINCFQENASTKLWLKPDKLADPDELKAFTERAKQHGIRTLTYLNPGRYGEYNVDKVIADIASLVNEYGLKGMYLDGLYRNNDWLKTYEFLRKLRDTVGGDGCIFIHNTVSPISINHRCFAPVLDAWGDYLYRGEGVSLTDPHDPHIRYGIATYHISNLPSPMWFLTNFGGVGEKGQWLWNKRFKLETFDEYRRMFDESLDYNLRAVWPYPSWETETGKFVDDSFLHYYLPMKSVREARWRAGEWKPIQDRE